MRRITVVELASALDVPPTSITLWARRLGCRVVRQSDPLDPEIVAAIFNADLRIGPPYSPEATQDGLDSADIDFQDDEPTHRPFRRKRTKRGKSVLPVDVSVRAVEGLDALEKRIRAEIMNRLPLRVEAIDAVLLARTGRRALPTPDALGRVDDVAELLDVAAAVGIDISEMAQTFQDTITILDLRAPKVLYEQREPFLYIPSAIVTVSDSLLTLVASNPTLLYEVTPRRFEEIIAELFKREGFDVELTKQTRDGGKDIIAVSRRMNVITKYIIECKRYGAHRKVDISLVQRLLGVKIATSANKAILATTSTYTRDARVFAADHLWDLDLKDIHDITRWLSPWTAR